MLSFFRKYQRYFLIAITVMIIVSFSFFGTYNAISQKKPRDEVVFDAVDGRRIHQSELHQMAFFLSTDTFDKEQYGPSFAANFLNDGVIRRDFFESGLGEQVILAFLDELGGELGSRLERERNYTPYVHPEARFLSAERVWGYFSPQLLEKLELCRSAASIASQDAVHNRIELYLAEQEFPQNRLKQVLAYQEQQYGWVSRDPYLLQRDMALFGYHTVEEWFGPKFTQLMAQLIINGAALAKERGYEVSNEAVEAELLSNAETAFQRDRDHLRGVTSSQRYMEGQLRVMGMDMQTACSLWKQVMLFRELLGDMGASVLVDSFMYDRFNQFSAETIEVELYRMRDDLHLSDFIDLQKFETYLDLVCDRSELDSITDLPTSFYSLEQIRERAPELVHRRYLIEVAEAYRSNQALKVGLKEIWEWELAEENWSQLAERWPELAADDPQTRRDRLEALDNLTKGTRALIDHMAQEAILDSHPEWIAAALDRAEKRTEQISIRERGGPPPLPHIVDRKGLGQALSCAPLRGEGEVTAELGCFSDDGEAYYHIAVIDRSDTDEILTFQEANRLGVLDELLERRIEQEMRKRGDLRPVSEARHEVALEIFAPIVEKYEAEAKKYGVAPHQWAAFRRFFPHMERVRTDVQHGSGYKWLVSSEAGSERHLATAEPLVNQWHLTKVDHTALRSHNQLLQPKQPLQRDPYEMAIGEWSEIFLPDDGRGPCFFQQVAKQPGILLKTSKIASGQRVLGREVQSVFLAELIDHCRTKGAIAL